MLFYITRSRMSWGSGKEPWTWGGAAIPVPEVGQR